MGSLTNGIVFYKFRNYVENKEVARNRRKFNENCCRDYVVVDLGERRTQTPNPSRYWTDIKRRMQRQVDRLGREELYDEIVKFPFKHPTNNRTYQFDYANQTGILRIVQDLQSDNELVGRLKL